SAIAEADGRRPRGLAEERPRAREVGVRLEAQPARILDGAEHQAPRQLDGHAQRRLGVGAKVTGREHAQLVGRERAWPDRVLDAEAEDVDEVAAHGEVAVAMLARDEDADEATAAVRRTIELTPRRGGALERQSRAPARADQAVDERRERGVFALRARGGAASDDLADLGRAELLSSIVGDTMGTCCRSRDDTSGLARRGRMSLTLRKTQVNDAWSVEHRIRSLAAPRRGAGIVRTAARRAIRLLGEARHGLRHARPNGAEGADHIKEGGAADALRIAPTNVFTDWLRRKATRPSRRGISASRKTERANVILRRALPSIVERIAMAAIILAFTIAGLLGAMTYDRETSHGQFLPEGFLYGAATGGLGVFLCFAFRRFRRVRWILGLAACAFATTFLGVDVIDER